MKKRLKFTRSDLASNVASFAYSLTRQDAALALGLAFGAMLIVGFLAPGHSLDFTASTTLLDAPWRWLVGWMPETFGNDVAGIVLRILGAGGAGVTALAFFVLLRAALPILLSELSAADYYRLRLRLAFWHVGIPLTVIVSLPFLRLFGSFTPTTLRATLLSLVVLLTIRRHQAKKPFYAVVAHILLGALSSMTILGFAILFACIAITILARRHSTEPSVFAPNGYGYSYGYGYGAPAKTGGQTVTDRPINENPELTDPFVNGRMRWLLTFLFLFAFLVLTGLMMLSAHASGGSYLSILTQWLISVKADATSLVSVDGLVFLVPTAVIPLLFASSRLTEALDTERFLGWTTMSLYFLASMIGSVTLVCFDLFSNNPHVHFFGNDIIPIWAQLAAGFAVTISATVFLVDMICRDFIRSGIRTSDDAAESAQRAVFRRSNQMMKPLVALSAVAPILLVAAALFLTFRRR